MRHVGDLAAVYDLLLDALDYGSSEAIAQFRLAVSGQPPEYVVKAQSMGALWRLDEVAASVRSYLAVSAPGLRSGALLQAHEQLESVAGSRPFTFSPIDSLIDRVVRTWKSILSAEGGRLGRAQLARPIVIPYQVGNPVVGDLFVGREDIMARLQGLWAPGRQPESVVIYGHRRMGKSSILKNISQRVADTAPVVDFNMQVSGFVADTAELLYAIAEKVHDSLDVDLQAMIPEPDRTEFDGGDAYRALERLLSKAADLSKKRVIITIDEFELIDQLMKSGTVNPGLLAFFRGLMTQHQWFVLALAGLHELNDLRSDYWQPLYASIRAIHVSFLAPESAKRLLTRPSPDFSLDYDDDVVSRVVELTNGQPYLVQLIGDTLVARFNWQVFEENIDRDRRLSMADLDAVLDSPVFYDDGDAYFKGVWGQANAEPRGQPEVLRCLTLGPMGLGGLTAATGLERGQIDDALGALQHHDVVTTNGDDQFLIAVPLMARWIERNVQPQPQPQPQPAVPEGPR